LVFSSCLISFGCGCMFCCFKSAVQYCVEFLYFPCVFGMYTLSRAVLSWAKLGVKPWFLSVVRRFFSYLFHVGRWAYASVPPKSMSRFLAFRLGMPEPPCVSGLFVI